MIPKSGQCIQITSSNRCYFGQVTEEAQAEVYIHWILQGPQYFVDLGVEHMTYDIWYSGIEPYYKVTSISPEAFTVYKSLAHGPT